MKRVLYFLCFFVPVVLFSQVKHIAISSSFNNPDEKLIDPIEIMPEYPGGEDAMFQFIESNINFQILNYTTDSIGKLIYKFVIDDSGKIRNIELFLVKNGKNFRNQLIENEIQRIFELMPKWKPAKLGEKDISCGFTFPFFIPYSCFKSSKFASKENISIRIDVPADFKYGNEKTKLNRISQFIQSYLQFPIEESESSIQGKVFVKCIVEIDGELKDFVIIKSLGQFCDREAINVIKKMPKWTPAIKGGKYVKSEIVIPVMFKLE